MSARWEWFGFCVAVAAFLVAVPPGNILINALTRKLERWWATTSTARRAKRLVKLRRLVEKLDSFTRDDWDHTLTEVLQESLMCGMTFLCYISVMFTTVMFFVLQEVKDPWLIVFLVVVTITLIGYVRMLHEISKVIELTRLLSPKSRVRVRREVDAEIESLMNSTDGAG